MYFCFDVLQELKATVALSCPNEELSGTVAKCCPQGQSLDLEDKCIEDSNNEDWVLHFNGHAYNTSALLANGTMIHDPAKQFFSHNGTGFCPKNTNYGKIRTDTFHLGPDSKLYYTPEHDTLSGTENFCVDSVDEGDYDYGEDEYYNDSEMHHINNTGSDYEPCQSDSTMKSIEIYYCAAEWIELHKCCSKFEQDADGKVIQLAENINVR